MSLLTISGLTKRFPNPAVLALDKVDLVVEAGDITAVVGPSGCGKSTLLRIVAGLDLRFDGKVTWSDPAARVALMPQHDGLFEWNRIVDNVAVADRIRGVPKAKARAMALELLTEFGLDEFSQAYPEQLSGGMRSRVAFLRTMAAQPTLIALDEPFGALDSLTRVQMQSWLLRTASERNLSILLITHDIEEAVTVADRVTVMSPRPGRVTADIAVELSLTERLSPEVRTSGKYLRAYTSIRKALANGAGAEVEEPCNA